MPINLFKTYLARHKQTASNIILQLIVFALFIVIAIVIILVKLWLFITTVGIGLMMLMQIIMWLFGQGSALFPNILMLLALNLILLGLSKLPGFFINYLDKDKQ